MTYKINRKVIINGVSKTIHANTEQEYANKIIKWFTKLSPTQNNPGQKIAEPVAQRTKRTSFASNIIISKDIDSIHELPEEMTFGEFMSYITN